MNYRLAVQRTIAFNRAAVLRRIGAGQVARSSNSGISLGLSLSLSPAPYQVNYPAKQLTLCGPFGNVTLAEGSRLLLALTGIDLDSAGSADNRQWLSAAVLGRLNGTPFADTEAIRFDTLPASDDELVATVGIHADAHSFTQLARADVATWDQLLRHESWRERPLPLARFDQLPLVLPLRVASHQLPAGLLNTLVPGDIIVPDQHYFDCNGSGTITLCGRRLGVRYDQALGLTLIDTGGTMQDQQAMQAHQDSLMDDLDADGFEQPEPHSELARDAGEASEVSDDELDHEPDQDEVTDQYEDKDENEFEDMDAPLNLDQYDDDHDNDYDYDYDYDYDNDNDNANAKDNGGEVPHHAPGLDAAQLGAADIDQLPVDLQFTMGRLRLTVGALRHLAAGTVITVDGGAPTCIAIESGGVCLGHGELVAVDEQPAIRIVQWRTPA